jgi:hypothetical protein
MFLIINNPSAFSASINKGKAGNSFNPDCP